MIVRLLHNGRVVSVKVPDTGDVEIDIDDGLTSVVGDVLSEAGEMARRLHRWIIQRPANDDGSIVFAPVDVERSLGLVPIALGRTLGQLQRVGVIDIIHRDKEGRGKILTYLVSVKSDIGTVSDESNDPWMNARSSIRSAGGDVAVLVFEALCRLADVSGAVLLSGSGVREIKESMDPVPDVFPSRAVEWLNEDGWIELGDSDEDFTCQICGWGSIGNKAPWNSQ